MTTWAQQVQLSHFLNYQQVKKDHILNKIDYLASTLWARSQNQASNE